MLQSRSRPAKDPCNRDSEGEDYESEGVVAFCSRTGTEFHDAGSKGRRLSPEFPGYRQQRPRASAVAVPWQVRSAGMAQQWLPLYAETLRERQHAASAERVDEQGCCLAYSHLFRSRSARLRLGIAGK